MEYLAKQGVLLLNNTFTVRQSSPNSHLRMEGYCNYIIRNILENQEGIIFLLGEMLRRLLTIFLII